MNDHQQPEDQALLRRFAQTRDEAAFRALVEKYTGLVFGVAMRRTGNAQAAEEIVQQIFLVLAKKAGSLTDQRSLGAWLHRSATLESLKSLRNDNTRKRHLAMIRDQLDEVSPDDEALWIDVRPHLDQLLDRLADRDREVLVLHYFDELAFADIAKQIGTTSAAAQKRSVRALQKLAGLLKKRGAIIPVAALGAGLGVELAPAAPLGLATQVASHALASTTVAAAVTTTTSSIITAMTASKIAIVTAFVIAASVPVGIKLSHSHAAASLPTENQTTDALRNTNRTTKSKFDPDEFRKALGKFAADPERSPARARRLQRLIFSLDLSQIGSVIAILEEFEDADHLHPFITATFSRWAELDPRAAIDNALSRGPERWGYSPLHGAWETWAFTDWDAALEWVTNTDSNPYDSQFLLWGHLDNIGNLNGLQAVDHAKQLGSVFPQRSDALLTRALGAWSKNDSQAVVDWITTELEDPIQRDAIGGDALETLGEKNPDAALDQVGLIDNPVRLNEVRYNIFWGWAQQQPKRAADYFAKSDYGVSWGADSMRPIGEAIARNLPERAIQMARHIEDPKKRDDFYVGILGGASYSGFEFVKEAADNLSAEGARTNGSLRNFMEDWASRDRPAALAWVDALPEGPKKKFAQHMFPRPKKKK